MPLPIPNLYTLLTALKKNQLVVSLAIMIIFAVWFANVWNDTSASRHDDNKQSVESLQKALNDERQSHRADNDKCQAENLSLQAQLNQVRLDQDAERKMLLNQLLDNKARNLETKHKRH